MHNVLIHLDRFKLALILILTLVFLQTTLFSGESKRDEVLPLLSPAAVHVFYHPDCPHCHKEMAFIEGLKESYPELQVQEHNITHSQELQLFVNIAKQKHIQEFELGTPLLIAGEHYLVGYDNEATTGAIIEQWIQELLAETPTGVKLPTSPLSQKHVIHVPLFGDIQLFETSLPVLAIVLGIVDGFNPCAMWVLAYLISLIVGIQDQRRIFTLIATFLLASGILYFLFMAAWLNVFLLIGYTRILTLLIGLAALYMGINTIRSFIINGGKVLCEVGDISSRQKTISKIQTLVASPLNLATIAGIIALAFAVNSIEFICSSALPAVFTHVLTIAELPTLTYYLYILLYVFFFMLDDLIIFTVAALAVERFASEKYAGYCHAIGGVIMLGLGILLTFFPEYLR